VALIVPEVVNVTGVAQADVVAAGVTVASAVNAALPPDDSTVFTVEGPAADDEDAEPDDAPEPAPGDFEPKWPESATAVPPIPRTATAATTATLATRPGRRARRRWPGREPPPEFPAVFPAGRSPRADAPAARSPSSQRPRRYQSGPYPVDARRSSSAMSCPVLAGRSAGLAAMPQATRSRSEPAVPLAGPGAASRCQSNRLIRSGDGASPVRHSKNTAVAA
jgi:hypothetical protein